jgi:uncharacterized membrane protein (GlpM family)
MPILFAPLLIKAVLTALVVVCAAVLAKARGPFWGALIASLPVSAGPAYVFLVMSHDSGFVAGSALGSLAANAATGAFLIVYGVTVRRLPGWSGLGAAVTTWLAASLAIRQTPWTPAAAGLLNLVVYGAGHFICHDADPTPARPRPERRWSDLPLRAVLVATFVCSVVVASSVLGPEATGIAAVFPISLGSLIVMLQPRLGGSASAQLATTALRAMFGFGPALLALHLTIEPWGATRALTTALLVTIAWSGLLLARRHPVAPKTDAVPSEKTLPGPCVRSQLP